MNSTDRRTNHCIQQLRSDDSDEFDSAFDELCKNIESIKHTIYRAALSETNSHAKGALVELLGESEDNSYVPYIAEQLSSKQPEVVYWSYMALKRIGTDEALDFARNGDIQSLLSIFRSRAINTREDTSDS